MFSSAGLAPGSKLNDRYGSLFNNVISGTPGAPHRQLAVNFGTGGKCRNKAASPANAASIQSILGAAGPTFTRTSWFSSLSSTTALAETVYGFAFA
jgi:hypothetical protein